MNKETQLLAMLDNVFGFPNKIRSKFRKVSQSFDQQTNEHVILIEYRVSVKGTMKSQPQVESTTAESTTAADGIPTAASCPRQNQMTTPPLITTFP